MNNTAELIIRLRKLNDRLYGGIETDLEEAVGCIEALQVENARNVINAAKEIVKLRAEVSKWMSLTEGNIKLNEHLTSQLTAPKLSKFKLLAITTAYEQGVGKGKQGTDFNPYSEDIDEHEAWRLGYQEGEGMAAPHAPTKEQT